MEPISLTDAVATDVPGPNKRVFAFLIDGITFSLAFAALSQWRPQIGGLWEYALWSIYFLLRDAAGGSLGKRLAGLTIVDGTGQPASTGRLIFRNLPVVIPFVVIAEYFVMKGASDGKRWGDQWAGTRVRDLKPHVSDGRFLLYSVGVVVALVAMRAFGTSTARPELAGSNTAEPVAVADLQGRPIGAWIEQLADDVNSLEAEKVIRAAGTAVTPALSNAVLTHANPKVRSNAARALGQVGGANSVAVLVKALKDPDGDVRNGAASGLFYRGAGDDPETASAITALTAAIKDPELWVRMEVARALESIGPTAKDAVPALLAAAQNQEDEAWHSYVNALRAIDIVTARQTIPLVVSAYDREKNDNTRFLIIALLRELKGPPEAVAPTFIRALDDRYDDVRESAAASLGEIGPPAAAAIPKLTRLLKDEDEDTRETAAEALKRIQGK